MYEEENKEITVALYLIFGFNEAKTNTLHLALHIYSNIDLDILQKKFKSQRENYSWIKWAEAGALYLSKLLLGFNGLARWIALMVKKKKKKNEHFGQEFNELNEVLTCPKKHTEHLVLVVKMIIQGLFWMLCKQSQQPSNIYLKR